jgi:hypothetical protein
VDEAELLPASSEERLEALLEQLREGAGVDLVALTVPGLEGVPIARFATARFEERGVGRGVGGRGLLLVVARQERLVRLEVGYAMEGVLPDAVVAHLERAQMVPYFADGRIGEGVEATIELLAERLYAASGAERAEPLDASEEGFLAGGAGGQAPVRFAGGSPRSLLDPGSRERFAAQASPREAWGAFLETNRLRIKDPELGLYDEGAKRRMRSTVSDAGQDHIVRLYGSIEPTVRELEDRAVILFPEDPDHLLAPWFFHRGSRGWQLDGATVASVVSYNHRNQWRFRTLEHPYMFAFADHRFDANGFAFAGREGAEAE